MTDAAAQASAQLDRVMFARRMWRNRAELDQAFGWFVTLVGQGAQPPALALQRTKVMTLVGRQLDLITEGAEVDRRIERAK